MTTPTLHLLKLCVGAESVDDLRDWQRRQAAMQRARGDVPEHVHVTRMWPRRADELLQGGSLFWVMKGYIRARQPIVRLDRVTGEDGIARCAIVLGKPVVHTRMVPRRPFQGWRYLLPDDAPEDLTDDQMKAEDALPPELQTALSDLGLK
jgi:hypothetical protein